MSTLLHARNLNVQFSTSSGSIKAVRGIDFHIQNGEIVGIVGESGCGKSVTALSLLKLLPKNGHFVSGEILFNHSNLVSKNEKEMELIRGRQIAFIPQDPLSALNPTRRIGSQMTEGLYKHFKPSKTEAHALILNLLYQVGISEPEQRINQYPHELSGGMRQRILIAMALTCQPQLLIADEPTTALDVTIQAQILDLLKKIQSERKFSILLITHDLGVVANFCDRVLVMYAGQIVEEAPVDQLFNNPLHPYTQALLKSKLSLNEKEHLYTISGQPPNLLNPSPGCLFAPRCLHSMPLCFQKEPPSIEIAPERRNACWLHQNNKETTHA